MKQKPAKGFSLVEVTLALGVMAFALVGIMAMFPIAMESARTSQQETRATFIAQAIFSDLSAGTNAAGRLLATGTNLTAASDRTPVNLADPRQIIIGYDEEGTPVGTNTPSAFTNAMPNPRWIYATRVSISTNGLISGLSRVEVEVTAPASAPLTNRSVHPFITLLRNQ
jgi:uncharacterized protein (TIGR02598 family)